MYFPFRFWLDINVALIARLDLSQYFREHVNLRVLTGTPTV